MRLTDEQVMQDNKRFANCNALAELKYCGWDIPHRKSITNDEIHFYAWLCRSAVALLKEQEAELLYREAKAITHTATKLDDATCPSCGNVVGEKIRTGAIGQSVVQVKWNYCRFCGQKLDWEGR